ncbi:MAG: V-type ATPase subunit [Clostridia bacterium]|nr:V-type ATPase subunit [Clostridia bacterium]
MALRYKDTDFMYASARVRALENSVISREATERLLEAKASSDIIAALPEYGFEIIYRGESEADGILREDTLLSVLQRAYSEVSDMCGDAPVADFLRYQYDCNNIKAVIKCNSRGVDFGDMLFRLGTLTPETVVEAIREKDYSALPENMAAAIPTAIEAFAESANPQQIDLTLDRACFADMLAVARATGVDYIIDLVQTKIDLLNIMTCIRIINMKMYFAAESFMKEAYLEGGTLGLDFFISGIQHGAQVLFAELEYSRYAELVKQVEQTSPLYLIEKAADDLWMERARKAKYIPFGAPVIVGYLVALEYEVKNLRIILAGKDAGLNSDVIKERLRTSYV